MWQGFYFLNKGCPLPCSQRMQQVTPFASSISTVHDLLERDVGEEGDGEEDGGDPAADEGDEGQDAGLERVCDALSGQILQHGERRRTQSYTTSN